MMGTLRSSQCDAAVSSPSQNALISLILQYRPTQYTAHYGEQMEH